MLLSTYNYVCMFILLSPQASAAKTMESNIQINNACNTTMCTSDCMNKLCSSYCLYVKHFKKLRMIKLINKK